MTLGNKPKFPKDLIGLLMGGVMLGALLLYGAASNQPLPFWPAIAVIGVNVFAAVRIMLRVRKQRAAKPPVDKPEP